MSEHREDAERNPPGESRTWPSRWGRVLAAGRSPTGESREALERLCEIYWYPVYAYARRSGHPPERAQELTQLFLSRLLEGEFVCDAGPRRGRLRSFLLVSLRRFLANDDRAATTAQDTPARIVTVERETAEGMYRLESVDDRTPEALFERRWALTVLERVLTRLRDSCDEAEQSALFARVEGYLAGEQESVPYDRLAREMGTTEEAIESAVRGLRFRFGALLRAEIAETVADSADADDELRDLFRILTRR